MLTIGELARQTDLTPGVLRAWERRHGFPRPDRSANGQRSYRSEDVAVVRRVLGLRDRGINLGAAIAEALGGSADAPVSLFAECRRRHPELTVQGFSQSALIALSRAVEDEMCAHAVEPVLFGAFQTSAAFRHAEARWEQLAGHAVTTVVFADFDDPSPTGTQAVSDVVRVTVSPTNAMSREWSVVCDALDLAVALVAWQTPAGRKTSPGGAEFECLWTVDPALVREMAMTYANVLSRSDPGRAGEVRARLDRRPLAPPADFRRVQGLLNRALTYAAGP